MPPNGTGTARPFTWATSAGRGLAWQFVQASGAAMRPVAGGFTCFWWAPTMASVAAVWPWGPTGGEAVSRRSVPATFPVRVAVPWQKVQLVCQAVPPWQPLQELVAAPDAAPKATWQVVQFWSPCSLAA